MRMYLSIRTDVDELSGVMSKCTDMAAGNLENTHVHRNQSDGMRSSQKMHRDMSSLM
jgi:hypothetical protein